MSVDALEIVLLSAASWDLFQVSGPSQTTDCTHSQAKLDEGIETTKGKNATDDSQEEADSYRSAMKLSDMLKLADGHTHPVAAKTPDGVENMPVPIILFKMTKTEEVRPSFRPSSNWYVNSSCTLPSWTVPE